ncbi:MAG: hypothetical protein R3344_00280 [Acidobacteriota bacterium]|nr:hypothetical protein [Acidobacteriota bacterium]
MRQILIALILLVPGYTVADPIRVAPRPVSQDTLHADNTARFGFAVPPGVERLDEATVRFSGLDLGSASYEVRISVPTNELRLTPYTDAMAGTVFPGADGRGEIDVSPLVKNIPGVNAGVDEVEVEVETTGGDVEEVSVFAATPSSTGGSSVPAPYYYFSRDVEGPSIAAGAIGNEADPYTPDHHVIVVENLRATTDAAQDDSLNTGGIAVVLHNYGDDDLSVIDLDAYDPVDHVLNTVNRNDHFLTFFRQNEDGSQDIVGRVEGISFWDMGEINQQIADFFADSGHLPWNWIELDVTFNDPSTWLQWTPPSLQVNGFVPPVFSPGSLPYFAYNNLNCEGNTNEVCLQLGSITVLGNTYNLGEIDTTFSPGSLPSAQWNSMADPFSHLTLDPGSLTGTPPLEFGDPFITVNGSLAETFAADLEDLVGSAAPVAFEMATDPASFFAKYLFALRGGVTYESGSGDYAEWLERADRDEELMAGEVVGVYGGKVTKKTENADHIMVVSYKPIVLGNMPPEARSEHFEKVAFMGQTLVKVWGVVEKGDFIVPSGREDGTGIAVSPDAITADQLGQVLGVAWGRGGQHGHLGLVNVAIGLRPVEVTKVIGEQQASLEALEQEHAHALNEIAALRAELGTMQATLTDLQEIAGNIDVLKAVLQRVETAASEVSVSETAIKLD